MEFILKSASDKLLLIFEDIANLPTAYIDFFKFIFSNSAVSIENEIVVKKLNPNVMVKGRHSIMLALISESYECADKLLKHGVSVNAEFPYEGATINALYFFSSAGNAAAVKYLIQNKADVNVKLQDGLTALMIAAYNGKIEVVSLLLEAGANPLIKDMHDQKPLDAAQAQGHLECSELISTKIQNLQSSPTFIKKNEIQHDLLGQNQAVDQINKVIALAKINRLRVAENLSQIKVNFHCVFSGAPGTGKTTFARYFADKMKEMEVLTKGHLVEVSKVDLIGQYAGQTPIKTTEVFKKALGGVLFIDEAYAIKTNQEDAYGQESIDILLKLIEDNRDDVIVIFAGYESEMNEFLNLNPGLKSRVPNIVNFIDYSDEELIKLLEAKIERDGLVFNDLAKQSAVEKLLLKKRERNFGNAREVRNLVEQIVARQAVRLSGQINLTKDQLVQIIIEDVLTNDELKEQKLNGAKNGKDQLSELIGLAEVKNEITSISNFVKISKIRNPNLSLKDLGLHMIFTGNPGTGKTTVARLMAENLKKIGVLPTNILIEADRSTLVAEWVGQTAVKTKEVFMKAIGGVLFIDEAYMLYNPESPSDFGKEAIETLMKLMEDYRGQIVVILAGYKEEMENFLNANPGISSRFHKVLNFADYNQDELMSILESIAKKENIIFEANATQLILDKLMNEKNINKKFGNARSVRKLYEKILIQQANRLSIGQINITDINTIVEDDVQKIAS